VAVVNKYYDTGERKDREWVVAMTFFRTAR
jgi:hypothetical protein